MSAAAGLETGPGDWQDAAVRAVLGAIEAAAREVGALAAGGGVLWLDALQRLTDATVAAEELARRQVASHLVADAGYAAARAPGTASRRRLGVVS